MRGRSRKTGPSRGCETCNPGHGARTTRGIQKAGERCIESEWVTLDVSPRSAAGDQDMDQDRFDGITIAVAEQGAGPTVTRRLFSGGAAALLVALGLRAAGSEDVAAQQSCRQRCRDKNTREKRQRCRRRCQNNDGPRFGCSPANNTQGSCPQGQICNPNAICVSGCTGTAGTQGSCPAGQLCNTGGQCQSQPLGCSPANNTQGSCPPGQLCNTNSICVAGCTGGPGQGSCPSGQQCRNGQCG
jgi:hypothetical protein